MTSLNSLADDVITLVLDTSVLINLYASKFYKRILGAIPNQVWVPRTVVDELERKPNIGEDDRQFIHYLHSQDRIHLIELADPAFKLYKRLSSGARSIDDGEAATIAIAATCGHLPVIDDLKGRRLAIEHLAEISPWWSLDLFLHPMVKAKFLKDKHIEAIYLALKDGRMRIDSNRCDEVVAIIGPERALKCPSLPDFKNLREQIESGKWKPPT